MKRRRRGRGGGNRGNIGEHTEPRRRQRKASGGDRYHCVVNFFWALSFVVSCVRGGGKLEVERECV